MRYRMRFLGDSRKLSARLLIQLLRFQTGTLKNKRGSHIKYLPFVYTEHGVIALAGVLRNETAIQASIRITKAFVEMRRIITTNKFIFEQISDINR